MLAEQPAPRQAYAAKAAPEPKPEAPASAGARIAAADKAEMAPAAAPLTEPQKIQRLIGYLEHLRGAVFIRNGSEYNGEQAADHLRTKLKYAGDQVKTAEDFIRLCATGSSMSGKPYRIRFADGTERNSADVLREQLKTMSP